MHLAVAYDCLFPFSKGGGEKQYRLFAQEFAAAGHRVTYLTRRQWDGALPLTEGFDVAVISNGGELYDDAGARRLGPAITFASGLFGHLLTHRRTYDAMLVSAMPPSNVLAARAALVGTKTVLAVDWLEVWRTNQWLQYSGPVAGRVANLIQKVAARSGALTSCHSQLNARRLAELSPRLAPIVSLGLVDGQASAQPSLAATEPPNVVYVGRHIPDKRVEALPAAIAHARTLIPDLTCTIFGDGQTRPVVLAQIERLGLRDVISTPGFVDQEALDAGLRSAACLVNPSRREGYGLVVVESSALGTPVVLVNGEDNAAVELIEEGVNGTVAASIAPEVLGEAIVAVVSAGAPLRRTTADWFERVRQTNTLQSAAARILREIEQAVARA